MPLIPECRINEARGTDHRSTRVCGERINSEHAVSGPYLKEHFRARVTVANPPVLADLDQPLTLVAPVAKHATAATDRSYHLKVSGEQIAADRIALVRELRKLIEMFAHLYGDKLARFAALRRVVRLQRQLTYALQDVIH